ncbi:hypothetical protein CSB37_02245 [bacterium DOLZORAL124_38_8]|nr:MAG: hypothetical protein CSB37_02245 [bacterium DOLZORAL124_38_8]
MNKQIQLLGAVLLLGSAVVFATQAVHYGNRTRKNITRRFSYHMRTGNNSAYLRDKTVEKKGYMRPRVTANKGVTSEKNNPIRKFVGGRRWVNGRSSFSSLKKISVEKKGYMRPRVTVDRAEKSPQSTPLRTITNRTLPTSKKLNSPYVATRKHVMLHTEFKPSELKNVQSESFALDLPTEMLQTSKSKTELTARTADGVKLNIEILSPEKETGFDGTARAIAETQLKKRLDVSTINQTRKVSEQFGKNHIKFLQTPATKYFEKVSTGNQKSLAQRVQENPNGGFVYMEVSALEKQLNKVLNFANQIFNSFNLN